MARKLTTGTGMTQRTRRVAENADEMLEVMKAFADRGDPFLARLDDIEKLAMKHCPEWRTEDLSPPAGDEDGPRGYAWRALVKLKFLRRFLTEGDAKLSADFALDLGLLLSESWMKPLGDQGLASALARKRNLDSTVSKNQLRDGHICQQYETGMVGTQPRTQAATRRRRTLLKELGKCFDLEPDTVRKIVDRRRTK